MRAVAIFIVFVGHLSVRFRADAGRFDFLWRLAGSGGVGVDIFFVLSGFLITTLLLNEYSRSGRIDLRAFYMRRAFRILPAFYVYLGSTVVLSLLSGWAVRWKDLAFSALFFYDYSPGPHSWLLAHTWSLAVEEQFYIFWPLLLGTLLSRWGKRAAIYAAIALIVGSTGVRLLDAQFSHDNFMVRDFMMLHTRVDTLMFGCLVALSIGGRLFESAYNVLRRVWWIFPVWFLAVGNLMTRFFGVDYRLGWGLAINGACIAFTILYVARNPSSWVGRALNLKWVATIGVLSYSIYLWQEPFTAIENTTWTGRLPGMLVCLAVFPLFSYYLVEKPMLRLRGRIVAARSGNKPEVMAPAAG